MVPVVRAEVIASEALELCPWEWLPRTFSQVVIAREIWTSCTIMSIVTQVSWRAAQKVRTRV